MGVVDAADKVYARCPLVNWPQVASTRGGGAPIDGC
jgi:hypothetical protein